MQKFCSARVLHILVALLIYCVASVLKYRPIFLVGLHIRYDIAFIKKLRFKKELGNGLNIYIYCV